MLRVGDSVRNIFTREIGIVVDIKHAFDGADYIVQYRDPLEKSATEHSSHAQKKRWLEPTACK